MPPDPSTLPAGERRLRVLIVEDDPAMAIALRDGFAYDGHAVLHAADGAEGLRLAAMGEVDLVILDVMLPRLSGLEICRQLRAAGNDVPIIMLTARGQESDKVQGLALGADDYVTKPFSFLELMARVQAVLRRTSRAEAPQTVTFGELTLDFKRLRATRAGASIELSAREFAILACLIARRGEVVSREHLLQTVWGYQSSIITRTVDMHIAKLRRKIGPELIVTVQRAGYRFAG